jgi:hypothetical protein
LAGAVGFDQEGSEGLAVLDAESAGALRRMGLMQIGGELGGSGEGGQGFG